MAVSERLRVSDQAVGVFRQHWPLAGMSPLPQVARSDIDRSINYRRNLHRPTHSTKPNEINSSNSTASEFLPGGDWRKK